ncbi:MAG: ATP-grasp domain-containing protein [Agitococcus sp.]
MTRVWYNKSFSFVYNIVQLIKHQDVAKQFYLIVSHTQAHARGLLVADESYVEPSGLVAKAYVDWCLAFCQQHKIDIFVVGKEAQTIAKYQSEFEQIGVRLLLVADAQTLAVLDNKALFAQQLPAHIAQLPDTIIVHSYQEFEQAYQSLRTIYPCLAIKPAVSIFGLGFRKIDEKRDCLQHILKGDEYVVGLDELRHAMQQQTSFNALLVMEFLQGDEWSVDCVANHGQLWVAVQRRKFMGNKGVPSQYIDNNADIAQMCQKLTNYFKLNGQFNIQFREGTKGIRLLEINARPSGGMAMACIAGANLPYIALKGVIDGYQSLLPLEIKTGIYVGEVSQALLLTQQI